MPALRTCGNYKGAVSEHMHAVFLKQGLAEPQEIVLRDIITLIHSPDPVTMGVAALELS